VPILIKIINLRIMKVGNKMLEIFYIPIPIIIIFGIISLLLLGYLLKIDDDN